MNRRRRPRPRTDIPDWRDPEMPVLGRSGREIDHNKLHQLAQDRVEYANDPDFRHDPTYNLRRTRR